MATGTTIESANEIILRAQEGGFFDRWRGQVFKKAVRDEIREAVRDLVPPEFKDKFIRMELRHTDLYPEQEFLYGDLNDLQDAEILRVWVSYEPMPPKNTL